MPVTQCNFFFFLVPKLTEPSEKKEKKKETQTYWTQWKKKKKKPNQWRPVKRRSKKKERKNPANGDQWKKKGEKKKERKNPVSERRNPMKKNGSKGAADLTSGSLHVCLIRKIPLKTELWKLKTAKMCFQFP